MTSSLVSRGANPDPGLDLVAQRSVARAADHLTRGGQRAGSADDTVELHVGDAGSFRELGAQGFQIFTNVAGKPLDSPEFAALFSEAARRDHAIWLHPAHGTDFSDYKTEDRSKYEIWWTFGWQYETSAAMSRIVFSGLFDRLPNLKIITHHLGGMIPYFEGRVGYGWDQLGSRTSDVDYTVLLKSMKKRPIDYFRLFYGDTALFGAAAATKCGLEFFGVDHVVFASDVPFEPKPGLYIRETIRVIEGLGLTGDEKDRIYRRNAERLLHLEVTSQRGAS